MENNKMMMIVVLVLLVVMLGFLAGVSFYVVNLLKNTTFASEDAASAGTRPPNVSQLDPKDVHLFALANPVATNLKTGADGVSHAARVSFSVGIDNTQKTDSDAILALIQDQEARIRDICLTTIRSMTYEELNREEGMDVLRAEILQKLQQEFKSNLIVSLSISDYWVGS